MPELTKENVVAIINKRHPRSFESLETILNNEGTTFSRKQLATIIDEIRSQGLTSLYSGASVSPIHFLTSMSESWWVYVGIIVPTAETALVAGDNTMGAAAILRLLMGLAILGYIPGYLTMRALFPRQPLSKLEGILLSVFLSVVIAIGSSIVLGVGAFFNPKNVSLTLTGYSVAAVLLASYKTLTITPTA